VRIYGEEYFRAAAGETHGQGYRDYVADEALHLRTARRRLDRLERLVEGRRLLDVGAAAGFFVAAARERGWDSSGVDVSPAIAAWARERLGVEVIEGTFSSYDGPDASLDAVTMWDYLEHSLDPGSDLGHAARLLRPGGVLALSTGDAATPVARLSGRRWHLLTPRHHLFFFTRATLVDHLARHGFEPVEIGYPGGSYPLAYVVHKLRTLVDVPLIDRAAERLAQARLGSVAVPLNLRDIVTVYARRRYAPATSASASRPASASVGAETSAEEEPRNENASAPRGSVQHAACLHGAGAALANAPPTYARRAPNHTVAASGSSQPSTSAVARVPSPRR
jgi:SAM-dependent methyltransferase